jgi:hypothetical protein
MYQQRRVLERIVTAEIMKLERRQALIRAGTPTRPAALASGPRE